ncbi:carbohydrate kinase [Chelatococcus sp. GCM10030263]|uniref:carbohydrate kinase family protein n=1 Tax=Chelatococcus sp. GCM10030263 TaxID=3273387 RepID=UPI00360E2C00
MGTDISPHLVVCGEALVDCFATVERSQIVMRGVPGGSPFNLAVGLARLGRPVAFLGALSGDAFGRHLRDSLVAEGVSTDFVKRSDRPTPLSVVSTATDGTVDYSFRNHEAADYDLDERDLPRDLPASVSCIAVGSYALALEPTGTAIERFAAEHADRCVISFDPNVRPGLIRDSAAWRSRFGRIAGFAGIVKVSAEDIALAFGREADPRALAREWRASGVPLVIVTRGADPVLAFGAFGEIERPVEPVAVVDTVGAGDSFHAALLAFLDAADRLSRSALQSLEPTFAAAMLAYAASAARITCGRRGADLPYAKELRG